MIKLEIVAGLKNALEHGFSIDEAKASFTNAGYSSIDVNDSANAINSAPSQQAENLSQLQVQLAPQTNQENSAPAQQQPAPQISSQIQQAQNFQSPVIPAIASPKPLSNFQTRVESIEKSSNTRNIIILSIVLLLLLSTLTATIFFKESVNSFLQNWF
ncbi:MAG: hypothetical protein AABX65_04205 [Nanoarchaeota archaeon]